MHFTLTFEVDTKPLILASLFLHLGHLPYTYSTERALLLASNLGDRNTDNKIKKYVLKRVKKAHDKANIDEEKKQIVLDNILSLRSYKNLGSLGISVTHISNITQSNKE